MDIYLRPHTSTSLSIYQRRSVFLVFFFFFFPFPLRGFQFCLRFWFSSYKMVSSVIRELQRGEGIGKSGLVETVHICSSRRRDKCSAYCLLWKLRLGSEPGKTRFTIFIRIIYITQLGHPTIRYFELPLSEQLIERM